MAPILSRPQWVKPKLKLEQGWLITYRKKCCMWLHIHALRGDILMSGPLTAYGVWDIRYYLSRLCIVVKQAYSLRNQHNDTVPPKQH